jgi:RimJ/RimL family protein N-acetyltransferase
MSPEPFLVTTARLTLVAPGSEVWQALLDGQSEPALEGYPTEGDLVMARLVVDGYLAPGEWGPWQVIERASGLLVGGVGFKGAPDDDGVVEIGYGLSPAARGRGLATEAVTALVEHARSRGVRAVRAEVDAANEPSMRVLERTGFAQVEDSAGITWWRRDLR